MQPKADTRLHFCYRGMQLNYQKISNFQLTDNRYGDIIMTRRNKEAEATVRCEEANVSIKWEVGPMYK